jgi:hypothetical protein
MGTQKSRFFIDNGFGGKDERQMQENFEILCGGVSRAERLSSIWDNSYPCGTQMDFLYGRGVTKRQSFEKKAKAEGFTQEQIDFFYAL